MKYLKTNHYILRSCFGVISSSLTYVNLKCFDGGLIKNTDVLANTYSYFLFKREKIFYVSMPSPFKIFKS